MYDGLPAIARRTPHCSFQIYLRHYPLLGGLHDVTD